MFIVVARQKGESIRGAIRPLIASAQPHIHATEEEAVKEANRLAAMNAKREFIVFSATSAYAVEETPPPPVVKFKPEVG